MSSSPLAVVNPSNFRDLADAVRPRLPLRRRTLFRSDHLGALDDGDARQIAALGIRRVLDFRGSRERLSAVCTLREVAVHSLAIEPTVIQKMAELASSGQPLTQPLVTDAMHQTYRDFVLHNTARFAEFFAHLLESDEPTVFHCTAGKDRTGFAAALVLHALGATREEVMRDYLLTNERYRRPTGAARGLAPEVAAVLWGVQPGFLAAAYETAEQAYGSLPGYLREGVGLGEPELARLRALYLRD